MRKLDVSSEQNDVYSYPVCASALKRRAASQDNCIYHKALKTPTIQIVQSILTRLKELMYAVCIIILTVKKPVLSGQPQIGTGVLSCLPTFTNQIVVHTAVSAT